MLKSCNPFALVLWHNIRHLWHTELPHTWPPVPLSPKTWSQTYKLESEIAALWLNYSFCFSFSVTTFSFRLAADSANSLPSPAVPGITGSQWVQIKSGYLYWQYLRRFFHDLKLTSRNDMHCILNIVPAWHIHVSNLMGCWESCKTLIAAIFQSLLLVICELHPLCILTTGGHLLCISIIFFQ